jgi:hypothetical protein
MRVAIHRTPMAWRPQRRADRRRRRQEARKTKNLLTAICEAGCVCDT